MIVLIGNVENRDSQLLSTAVEIRDGGASSALFSMISSDGEGRAILERLVDHDVLFDPGLCCVSFPQSDAWQAWSEEKLLDALRVNTDVRAILLAGDILRRKESLKIVLDALDSYGTKPVLVVQWDGKGELDRRLRKKTDILCVQDDAYTGKVSVLTEKEGKSIFQSFKGWEATVKGTGSWNERVAGFLTAMHQNGCFGIDGGKPLLAITKEKMEKLC